MDRSHKRYPVKADIKGLSLSTTLQETVRLIVEDDKAVKSLPNLKVPKRSFTVISEPTKRCLAKL